MPTRCEHAGCSKRPTFDHEGGKGRFCKDHKEKGMIDVKSKRCEHAGCLKRPYFDHEGGQGRFCKDHKEEDMMDVKNKRCEHTGCSKRSYFDHEGGKGRFCKDHKEKGMIDVIHERCEHTGCSKRSYFDHEGGKGRFCNDHKEEGMSNIKGKRCEHTGCSKHPMFDHEGGKGRFCKDHKEEGMIDVKNKRCEHAGCCKRPVFDHEGGKGRFCATHKEEDMIDVNHTRCKTPHCTTRANNPAYEGYCLRCFMFQFPDKPVARNYKTKERAVVEHILTTFAEYEWITDKRIEDGCSSRRPDLLLHLGSHAVIVEVDENQHDTEEYCSCENKRIMQISQDLQHVPLVFLRFNPDGYTNHTNAKVPSCWCVGKDGILRLRNAKRWEERLTSLTTQVKYWIENPPTKTIEIVQLFFDGFTAS